MKACANLTRLGFGVTGPHATPAVAREDTLALIREAVGVGVRVFDTGPMYGAGEAEARTGAALRALEETGVDRASVFVSTKARTWPLKPTPQDLGVTPSERVFRSLHESLERLGTPHVDALFLHGPRLEDLTPVLFETLEGLRADGLARFIGVCGRGPELDAALEFPGVDLLMMPVHGEDARLARAAAQGVRVLAIETMRARANPWRLPTSGADLWYLARAARDAAVGAAAPVDTGVAAALTLPSVACVVVQTTRRAHLLENARAAQL